MTLPLGELAARIGAKLNGDKDCLIERVADLRSAESGSVSFLTNRRFRRFLTTTRASAVILTAEDVDDCPVSSLVVGDPYLSYARAAALLHPEPTIEGGVDPSASVSEKACLHDEVWVGPKAVIEAGAKIGAHCRIGPGCTVREGVVMGEDVHLVANVTVCHEVRIGDRVEIHPGAVIGSDGFGHARDGSKWIKVPQLGTVIIGNDVSIGANTTIDRGALGDTVIELGVKLDNLIQIAHNVHIGEDSAIAGCVGIAGSATIGKRCTLAGQVGVVGHVEIADDVHVTARAVVWSSIREPGVYSSGLPLEENRTWRRNYPRYRQLDKLARRLKELEKTGG